ncbi:MAG TPA: hypothetical protein VNL73_02555 [Verrucomicrobiae bacterium]|nr:hypothetical protein [Verrucomicrobiae bacterium]
MRRLGMIALAVFGLVIWAGAVFGQEVRAGEKISFYEVPLECGAAADLGCGSRAKPALLEMEQNPAIKEAWLNRTGTVYAVVWRGKAETKKAAGPVFKKHSIEFKELGGKEKALQMESFRREGKWYRGASVDQLSLEEAEILGKKVVNMLLPGGHISEAEAAAIGAGVTAYFKEELVKIRTYEELCRDNETKFQQAIIGIVEKQVGKERTEKIVELFGNQVE